MRPTSIGGPVTFVCHAVYGQGGGGAAGGAGAAEAQLARATAAWDDLQAELASIRGRLEGEAFQVSSALSA